MSLPWCDETGHLLYDSFTLTKVWVMVLLFEHTVYHTLYFALKLCVVSPHSCLYINSCGRLVSPLPNRCILW